MDALTSAVKPLLFVFQIPRSWAINRCATTALAAVALLTLLSFGLSGFLLNELASARDWVLHTYAVRSQVERVSWDFDTLENGLRGFVLTGAEAERAKYERAQGRIPSDLDRIATRERDSPV